MENILDMKIPVVEEKEEIHFNPEFEKLKDLPLRKLLPPNFLSQIDPHFRTFCRGIRKNLREENYEIVAITGYAGYGKSTLGAIFGCLVDPNYSFSKSINFLPTSSEIEKDYLKLPCYSNLHIDEASRSIHKHKWYEKTQQKLAQLYDTERENHYICTSLLMPRFNNFTENFRNFFIKYWINVVCRGVALVYRRDEDKDTKDPWNVDHSIKLKNKMWKNKRIFERTIGDVIRMEQKTKNYWFYFTFPELPKDVWGIYQQLKSESRIAIKNNEANVDFESFQERKMRERMDKWKEIVKLKNEGKSVQEIAIIKGLSSNTIKTNLREIDTYNKIKGDVKELEISYPISVDSEFRRDGSKRLKEIPKEFDKIE